MHANLFVQVFVLYLTEGIAALPFVAARAHEVGWTVFDLFGVHPVKPWVRFDHMGLVPLLNGARVIALSDLEAVIEKSSGARLTYRRRAMAPEEACLIWELRQL